MCIMGRFSFSKHERLLKRKDFVNLNRKGKRYYSQHFIVIARKNEFGITRLGITVTKKTGNAVVRNRIKRLVREFFRLNKASVSQGYDIVIIARKDTSHFNFEQIQAELQDVVIKNINAQRNI